MASAWQKANALVLARYMSNRCVAADIREVARSARPNAAHHTLASLECALCLVWVIHATAYARLKTPSAHPVSARAGQDMKRGMQDPSRRALNLLRVLAGHALKEITAADSAPFAIWRPTSVNVQRVKKARLVSVGLYRGEWVDLAAMAKNALTSRNAISRQKRVVAPWVLTTAPMARVAFQVWKDVNSRTVSL